MIAQRRQDAEENKGRNGRIRDEWQKAKTKNN